MVNASALPSAVRATRVPRAAVVVAHPDDETLWCGGLIQSHPNWDWRVVTLCRASDPDRAGKFHQVMGRYGATGYMGDLDDGPEQKPLPEAEIRNVIAELLPARTYDLMLTHGPAGEYTRHRRHEECSRAVGAMWQAGDISLRKLWLFAYEDAGGGCLPHASGRANRRNTLRRTIWEQKRRILIDLYGFSVDAWEVRVAPRVEGFYCYTRPADAQRHIAAVEIAP